MMCLPSRYLLATFFYTDFSPAKDVDCFYANNVRTAVLQALANIGIYNSSHVLLCTELPEKLSLTKATRKTKTAV